MSNIDKLADLHNRLAPAIVRQIIHSVSEANGGVATVMLITETVLFGMCVSCVKLGGDEHVLDHIVKNVKQRLAEYRLKNLPPAGEG